MDTGSSSCNAIGKGKKTDKSRRVWSRTEEEVLLEALKDLVTKGWKSENGFRCGYLALLEETMKKVFPRTDLRANPHINSKIHVWKKTHGSLVTILSRSGMGWNDSEKKIEASDEAWECFVKGDSSARSMRYKSWPYYSEWCEIFGHDRATGANSMLFAEAVQDVLNNNTDMNPGMQVGLEDMFNNVEEAGESMSVANTPTCNNSVSKQTNSKKRKKQVQGEELVVAAIDKFTEMSWRTMSDLVKRVGVEYELVNATKDVYDALRRIPELTSKERLAAAALLVEKPKQLTLFFSLPEEDKLEMVRMILNT